MGSKKAGGQGREVFNPKNPGIPHERIPNFSVLKLHSIASTLKRKSCCVQKLANPTSISTFNVFYVYIFLEKAYFGRQFKIAEAWFNLIFLQTSNYCRKNWFLHQINITKMISFCTHQKCFSLGYFLSGFHCKMDWNI